MSRLARLRTLGRLGPRNLGRVGMYRAGLKFGWHPSVKLVADPATGPFFGPSQQPPNADLIARPDWQVGKGRAFGQPVDLPAGDGPPDWFTPLDGDARANSDSPWWQIADFNPEIGDIKRIWEASRFDWLLPMAQRAALGDAGELARLNDWIADWSTANRPYRGSNWKCGQEASIRVMHLAAAAIMLGTDDAPTDGLRNLIRLHLKRIAPTMSYAIGQSNNHGTSEAAALFIGGSWLNDATGRSWAATGRKWLQERAGALIETDGSFSQYSVTYHRLMLDTYCLAEVWRRRRGLPAFSDLLMTRLTAATRWLEQMTDADNGDTPVIGANDGAQILALTNGGYRDFRPSVQLGTTLFTDKRAYAPGPCDQQTLWLSIDLPKAQKPAPESVSFDKGGYHVLRRGSAVAYLRYPRFRYRPSQADALHCDLWVRGENLLRDAGTYSYNSSPEDLEYFPGTAAHNTVQFDGRDQMPRQGRFLFGNWLRSEAVEAVKTDETSGRAAAAYRDGQGVRHARTLDLGNGQLTVTDDIAGFGERAVLRWRLAPGRYQLDGQAVSGHGVKLEIMADMPITRIALVRGFESRFYLQKNDLPVMEVEVSEPGRLTTRINF